VAINTILDDIEINIQKFQQEINQYQHQDLDAWANAQLQLGYWYIRRLQRGADDFNQAITAFEKALTVYTQLDNPDQWAYCQGFLGILYHETPHGIKRENIENAHQAIENALKVYTKGNDPNEWARYQSIHGLIYAQRSEGLFIENLEKAIAAFENALQVYTRESHPKECARNHAVLGQTYVMFNAEKDKKC
jgi:tetratricopeptide (TPR) repeat protein